MAPFNIHERENFGEKTVSLLDRKCSTPLSEQNLNLLQEH